MNCLWRDVEGNDGRGWRRVQCERCGFLTGYTPHEHARIHNQCHAWPFPHELGHWLTLLLAALGIQKSGYVWLKRRLGLSPTCGCNRRAAKLNTLVASVAVAFRRWVG